MQIPNGSGWPWRRTKKEKSKTGEVIATTQLRWALETEEERRAKNGLDLIWIEIGLKIKKTIFFWNELARPNGNHFSSLFSYTST